MNHQDVDPANVAEAAATDQPGAGAGAARPKTKADPRPPATLYAHIDAAALDGRRGRCSSS